MRACRLRGPHQGGGVRFNVHPRDVLGNGAIEQLDRLRYVANVWAAKLGVPLVEGRPVEAPAVHPSGRDAR